MMDPDEELEFNTSDAKRVYLSDDSAAVFFVKRFQEFTAVLRKLLTAQESRQNHTNCYLDD